MKLDLPKIPDDISLLRGDLAASILGTTSRVNVTLNDGKNRLKNDSNRMLRVDGEAQK